MVEHVIPITVRVPLVNYPRVADLAEQRGFDTIAQWIESVVGACARAGHDAIDPVEILVRAGLPDAAIAEELGFLPGTAADRRRRLGLPPNRRYARRAAS